MTTPKTRLSCHYRVCAAHQLYRKDWSREKNQSVFGKCAAIHGHEYQLVVYLTGEVDKETSILINGYDVDKIVGVFIRENFDHKFLNEDVAFFKDHLSTAETIAFWVFQELKGRFPAHVILEKVKVFETTELAAEYSE